MKRGKDGRGGMNEWRRRGELKRKREVGKGGIGKGSLVIVLDW